MPNFNLDKWQLARTLRSSSRGAARADQVILRRSACLRLHKGPVPWAQANHLWPTGVVVTAERLWSTGMRRERVTACAPSSSNRGTPWFMGHVQRSRGRAARSRRCSGHNSLVDVIILPLSLIPSVLVRFKRKRRTSMPLALEVISQRPAELLVGNDTSSPASQSMPVRDDVCPPTLRVRQSRRSDAPSSRRHVDPRSLIHPLDFVHDLLRQCGVLLYEPRHPHNLVGHRCRLWAIAHVQVTAVFQAGDPASDFVDIQVSLRLAESRRYCVASPS